VVCSLFKAEGEEQIAGFLQENQDFRLVKFDLPDWVLNDAGQMRSLPFFQVEQGGMDGFFASLLQRV
jgi:16S rRNA C967 or C1407 C5-methylase (RsmB/RsmF family)